MCVCVCVVFPVSSQVYCNMESSRGGWTVIQLRSDGTTDFHRTWKEYKMVGERRKYTTFTLVSFDQNHTITNSNSTRGDATICILSAIFCSVEGVVDK